MLNSNLGSTTCVDGEITLFAVGEPDCKLQNKILHFNLRVGEPDCKLQINFALDLRMEKFTKNSKKFML